MDRLGWGRHLVGTELFKPELETFKLETYCVCVHACDQNLKLLKLITIVFIMSLACDRMTLFSGVGDILNSFL